MKTLKKSQRNYKKDTFNKSLKRKSLKRKSLKRKSLKRKSLKRKSLKGGADADPDRRPAKKQRLWQWPSWWQWPWSRTEEADGERHQQIAQLCDALDTRLREGITSLGVQEAERRVKEADAAAATIASQQQCGELRASAAGSPPPRQEDAQASQAAAAYELTKALRVEDLETGIQANIDNLSDHKSDDPMRIISEWLIRMVRYCYLLKNPRYFDYNPDGNPVMNRSCVKSEVIKLIKEIVSAFPYEDLEEKLAKAADSYGDPDMKEIVKHNCNIIIEFLKGRLLKNDVGDPAELYAAAQRSRQHESDDRRRPR